MSATARCRRCTIHSTGDHASVSSGSAPGRSTTTSRCTCSEDSPSNNSQYLSYLLKTMRLGNLSGQSAQPGLSVKVLSQQAVSLPSLDGQRQAVAILGTLDRKIELNNRLNGYLAA
ncbi:MAG: restriction endonuclease subunit S [Collinsella stercoris]|uniref:restriction endonuclease subunit S n=1 Tax=Collinsella stercoris TaxID=147206 RepID=UPI0039923234